MIRFDCKGINSIQILRLPTEYDQVDHKTRKMLTLVAACNDGYLRFFNMQGITMCLASKGKDHNGVPLSFDFSPCKNLVAVGYEDDSFVVYNLTVKYDCQNIEMIPVVRGVGHKNFIQSIKFDTFF